MKDKMVLHGMVGKTILRHTCPTLISGDKAFIIQTQTEALFSEAETYSQQNTNSNKIKMPYVACIIATLKLIMLEFSYFKCVIKRTYVILYSNSRNVYT